MDNAGYKKISIFDEHGSVVAAAGNVDINENRIILLGEDFCLLPHNTVVYAVGYGEDGIVSMEGRITLSTASQMNLDVLNYSDKEERRNYLKVPINAEGRILKMYSLGKRGLPIHIDKTITLRDISVGGIGFYSNQTLFKQQRLLLRLDAVKQNFTCEAVVLRREKTDFGNCRYKYGCEFLQPDHEQQRALCSLVFKVQIETHKKEIALQYDEEEIEL